MARDCVPRLSYWTLRCFVLKTLRKTKTDRTRFTTLIGKVARHYGTRRFLASPRNERNLADVIAVLLLSKRYRLCLTCPSAANASHCSPSESPCSRPALAESSVCETCYPPNR